MENLLVTDGGDGFIGAHLVELCCQRAPSFTFWIHRLRRLPRVAARPSSGFHYSRDLLSTSTSFAQQRDVNLIFHSARFGFHPRRIKDPLSVNRIAPKGLFNLPDRGTRENGVKRRDLWSSAASWQRRTIAACEDSILQAHFAARVALLAGEQLLCGIYKITTDSKPFRLRYFNVYGREFNGAPMKPANVLASVLEAVASGRRPLIFGDGMQHARFRSHQATSCSPPLLIR